MPEKMPGSDQGCVGGPAEDTRGRKISAKKISKTSLKPKQLKLSKSTTPSSAKLHQSDNLRNWLDQANNKEANTMSHQPLYSPPGYNTDCNSCENFVMMEGANARRSVGQLVQQMQDKIKAASPLTTPVVTSWLRHNSGIKSGNERRNFHSDSEVQLGNMRLMLFSHAENSQSDYVSSQESTNRESVGSLTDNQPSSDGEDNWSHRSPLQHEDWNDVDENPSDHSKQHTEWLHDDIETLSSPILPTSKLEFEDVRKPQLEQTNDGDPITTLTKEEEDELI